MIDRQIYKQHYGLEANLLVLWAFASFTRMKGFQDMAATSSPGLVKSTLCQTISIPEALYLPDISPFASAWTRPDQSEVQINTA